MATKNTKSTKVDEVEDGAGCWLLPPAPDCCQVCAVKHDPALPHNAQSLYYHVSFFGQQGRYPNWKDAMAHCTAEMKEQWVRHLTALGVDVEAGQVNPAKRVRLERQINAEGNEL